MQLADPIQPEPTDVSELNILKEIQTEVLPHIKNARVRQDIETALDDPVYTLTPKKFYEALQTRTDLQELIILREEHHQSDWGHMLSFLRGRIQGEEGRPYNFKLQSNCARSYPKALKLQQYEQKQRKDNESFNLTGLL